MTVVVMAEVLVLLDELPVCVVEKELVLELLLVWGRAERP